MEPQPHANASGRRLELELIRVRAEASAARLEARAAELELILLAQRPQSRYEATPSMPPSDPFYPGQAAFGLSAMDDQRRHTNHEPEVHRSVASEHEDVARSLIAAIRRLVEQGAGGGVRSWPVAGAESLPAAAQNMGGWESRLSGLRGRDSGPIVNAVPQESSSVERVAEVDRFADRIAMASQTIPAEPQPDNTVADTSVPMPEVAVASTDPPATSSDAASEPVKRPRMDASPRSPAVQKKVAAESIAGDRPSVSLPSLVNVGQRAVTTPIPVTTPISISEEAAGEEKPKRLRPAGWLVSTTAHIVALLVLGLFTLANPKPKDQLAFTASASEVSEMVVESFTIESAEEMPDVTEPTPTETAADISPLGTMKMAEVSLDLPTVVASPMATAMSDADSRELMKLAKAGVKGDTPSKVQFAGLDGGGNHFVYLVDSSNSMKKFNDARTELLRSIDSLKPDQRFYVVFYDENPKYMRIANPSQEEPASVYATPENKQAFRRWAMAVQQARGQSPPEVLKFAFKLRPDVIFLLSDGEFTGQTETVIRENNLQENLFGESGPISIIHTIRYPGVSSTEGRQAEVQMQRIAAENGGQYRNVEIN